MNWAAVVYIGLMGLAALAIYKVGKRFEKLNQARLYKKGVDAYIERQNEVMDINRSDYSDDDIMSGKVLEDSETK